MWQPIETAPINQTFLAVLDCAGERTVCTMRRPVAEAKNRRPDHPAFHVERVTHWMPLPDLPGAQPAPSAQSGAELNEDQWWFMELLAAAEQPGASLDLRRAVFGVVRRVISDMEQQGPSVPDDVRKDAERYRFLEHLCATGSYGGIISRKAIDAAILAASPEAKP